VATAAWPTRVMLVHRADASRSAMQEAVTAAGCEVLVADGGEVRFHHERWDGGGYPDGLAGERIPWGARLVGAAEVFDALTTSRPYRREQPLEEAIERMRAMKGAVLDPQVFDALAAIVDRRRALVFIDGREPTLTPSLASALMAG
jgi:hypothetical protein